MIWTGPVTGTWIAIVRQAVQPFCCCQQHRLFLPADLLTTNETTNWMSGSDWNANYDCCYHCSMTDCWMCYGSGFVCQIVTTIIGSNVRAHLLLEELALRDRRRSRPRLRDLPLHQPAISVIQRETITSQGDMM